ncbi:MAG: shikimate kinase [Spirochaetota bacterium]
MESHKNSDKIYLMGMKHTGKSRHGRMLAETLGRAFWDTDALIQELDAADTGMRRTVRDIYLEDGADRFRQLEHAACELAAQRDEASVIATGGGLCDNPEAVEVVQGGLRVHLLDALEALEARIFRGGIPAFLHTQDDVVARERFGELYERRVSSYDSLADLRVDLRNLSLAEAQSVLRASIEEYMRGRK